MRVLVTGATGFLGSHVVRALLAERHEVRAFVRANRPRAHVELSGVECVEGDVRDQRSLDHACRGVDGVVHAAGLTALWSRRNAEQWSVNVDGTASMFRAAHDAGVKRIVHVSSAGAIGATRDGSVLDESARWFGPVHRIHYVTTKKEAEERALAAAWAGMPVVIVNPSMLVGPRFDGRAPSSLLVRVASRQVRLIPPGGVSVADVEDVALALVRALERGTAGERYLLAGVNATWREFFAAVAREAHVAAPNFAVPRVAARMLDLGATLLDGVGLSRPRFAPEIYRSWGWTAFYDSSKAQRELGLRVRPLDEIVRRTLDAWRATRASTAALGSASSAS